MIADELAEFSSAQQVGTKSMASFSSSIRSDHINGLLMHVSTTPYKLCLVSQVVHVCVIIHGSRRVAKGRGRPGVSVCVKDSIVKESFSIVAYTIQSVCT